MRFGSVEFFKVLIKSVLAILFFLPLAVAGIHVAVAFPLVSELLSLLNLSDGRLHLICTVVCFMVFAVMYSIIYLLTAKTYYKIVRR